MGKANMTNVLQRVIRILKAVRRVHSLVSLTLNVCSPFHVNPHHTNFTPPRSPTR